MNQLDLARKVVARVRNIYKYVPEYRDVLKQPAHIEFVEDSNGNPEVFQITFRWFSYLCVSKTAIAFVDENGLRKELMTFKDLDNFLDKTG